MSETLTVSEELKREFLEIYPNLPSLHDDEGKYTDPESIANWWYKKTVQREAIARRKGIKRACEVVTTYLLWAKEDRDEQLGKGNVMLAYDMDSRQVAAKHIEQKILAILTQEENKEANI